jgi:hypothetical protein
VTLRLLPYWYDAVVPDLRRYGCVLVAALCVALLAGKDDIRRFWQIHTM